jgi:poly(A) polymerase
VRFASRLGFRIEPATYNAILRHHAEILKASPPRVFDELHKLFAFGAGEKAFRLLYKTGLLHDLLPAIADFLDHDRGQDSVLWKWLRLLDERTKDAETTSPVLIFAALFSAPIERVAAHYAAEGRRVIQMELLNDLIMPVCMRLSMPKWMIADVIQVMANQSRFEPGKRKRFSKRGFVAQDCFPETLALYEMRLLVEGRDTEDTSAWSELRREMEDDGTVRSNKGKPRRAPRKRPARRARR